VLKQDKLSTLFLGTQPLVYFYCMSITIYKNIFYSFSLLLFQHYEQSMFSSCLATQLQNVAAQSTSTFAAGEGERLFDLLNGLGCTGNASCPFSDFTPTTACDYKPADGNDLALKCDSDGLLTHFYLQNQHLSGTITQLEQFSALTAM
jgi:hypothetical protein